MLTANLVARVSITLAAVASVGMADPLADHPLGQQLEAIFSAPAPAHFEPTGVERTDYLHMIEKNVDFFRPFQNESGAIIDPSSHGERQYSTPAFALAAATLVECLGRSDLKQPAINAFDHSLRALVDGRTADAHSDFYIPLLIHAYRALQTFAPSAHLRQWSELFECIDPTKTYHAELRGMNWNLVSTSGELLRHHDGLVRPDQRQSQLAYLEQSLAGHIKSFTRLGLFEDPKAPMAYDAFGRLWLEDVFADRAYDGASAAQIESYLRVGGLSTLLMLSPNGEWPTGGRSAMHNWTDAQALAICEMNANYWKRLGRDDIAGAYKRAAHLAFKSILRWVRPGGDLNIIKNRAEPSERFAYETYSNHSQYNLLPMAMLAIAYRRADDGIAERPSPSEVGGYVFDARDRFHKVFAAAGGYYIEIDTAADPHYNATGLQRVQHAGIPSTALSDTAAVERLYGDQAMPKAALSLGVQWLRKSGANWMSLSDYAHPGAAKLVVKTADLTVHSEKRDSISFTITYTLAGGEEGEFSLAEKYEISASGVRQISTINAPVKSMQVRVPILLNNGRDPQRFTLVERSAQQTDEFSTTLVLLDEGSVAESPVLTGPILMNHSGCIQAANSAVVGESAGVLIQISPRE